MGIFEDLTKPISQQSDTSDFDFDAYLQEKIKPYKKKTVAPDPTSEFTPEKVTKRVDGILGGLIDLAEGGFNSLEPTSANVIATGLEGVNQFASDPIGTVNKLTLGSALRLGGMIGDAVTNGNGYEKMDKWLSENTESGVKLFDPNTSILRDASEGWRQHSKQYSEKNPIPDSFMGELGAGGTSFSMTVVPTVITALATKNPATVAKVAQSLGYALETSSQYQDLLDSGYKPEEAMMGSHTYGIMASILNKQVPEKIAGGLTKDFLKKGYKKLFKEMTERGTLEGFTEVTEDVLATSLKWNKMDDKQKEEYLKGLPSQAARTFAVSFILGVAGGLPGDVNQIRNEKSRTKLEEEFGTGEEIQIAKPEVEEVKLTPEQQLKKVRNDAISTEYKATIKNIDDSKAEIRREVNRLNGELKIAKNDNEIIDEKRISGELAKLKEQLKSLDSQRKTAKEDAIKKIDEVENLKENEPTEGLTQEKSPVDLFNQRMKETNFEQQTADLQKLTPTEATEPQTPVKGMEVKAEVKEPVIEETKYEMRKSKGGWSVDKKENNNWGFVQQFRTKKEAQNYIDSKQKPEVSNAKEEGKTLLVKETPETKAKEDVKSKEVVKENLTTEQPKQKSMVDVHNEALKLHKSSYGLKDKNKLQRLLSAKAIMDEAGYDRKSELYTENDRLINNIKQTLGIKTNETSLPVKEAVKAEPVNQPSIEKGEISKIETDNNRPPRTKDEINKLSITVKQLESEIEKLENLSSETVLTDKAKYREVNDRLDEISPEYWHKKQLLEAAEFEQEYLGGKEPHEVKKADFDEAEIAYSKAEAKRIYNKKKINANTVKEFIDKHGEYSNFSYSKYKEKHDGITISQKGARKKKYIVKQDAPQSGFYQPDKYTEFNSIEDAVNYVNDIYKERYKGDYSAYDYWELGHKDIVRIALKEGKPVPPEVLKDYPELSPSKDRIVEPTGATGTDTPVSKRVFSEDKYKQDRKDANDILNRPNFIGAQLEAVPQMLRIAGYHLENVVRAGIEKGRQFTEWTKSMIKDLGGKIRPYLKKIWEETQRQFGKKLLQYAEKNPFIRGMNVVEGSLFANDNLPPVRKYTDKDLEVLFEKNPVVRKKVSEFTKKTKETADDILRPMSAEIEQIDKDTYAAIKENDFETLAETNRRIKQITPFLEKFVRFRKYQPKEFAKLSYYLTANNMVEAEKIMSKWKMSEAFKPVRDALNELYVEGVKVKYDLGYLKDYFPRDMVDYEGYLKEIRGKKAFDVFQELIDKKNAERKKKGEAVLTTDEENKLITNAIRGYNPGISLSGIANYKERVIKAFPPSYAKYYDTAENALINYIVKATDAIQQRKLFGYGVDAEASIASYIKGKGLDAEKSAKLKRILKARYNFMSNKWASQVRGIMYLTTLNNPTSSIKNLADVPMALYNSGSLTKTFVALGRALVNKSVIKMEDAGLHNMGGEYMNLSSRNKATNAMMKWMLAFPYFDKVGKETYINATMSKYHKLANSNPDKLKTKLGKWFNEERASQVVSDLRQKKSYKDIGKTNLLNLVAYLEISDVQPTTMTEMPLKYAESPNGRVLYTMKSFQLKRLDFFRKETLHKIRTKGQRLEGFRNLAMLTTMIGLGEAGTEQIISWLLGRDESFTEQIADSMLSIIGFNRYDVEKAKRTNPIDVIFNKALPIATPLKDLWDDYETAADNYELTRYLTTHKTDRPFKAKSLNALPWVRTIRKNIENR